MASIAHDVRGQGAGTPNVPEASTQPDLSYIADALRPLAVDVSQLVPDPANARKHDERNITAIRSSLSRFGQRIPIVVQKQGMVVRAGNGRLQAAKLLGWTHIAAVIVDEASIDATAYAIADNRTAELAEWDNAVLAGLLESLPKDVLASSGFNSNELDLLLAKIGEEIDATPAELWTGMPSYEAEQRAVRSIVVHFKTTEDVADFALRLGQDFSDKARSIWHPQVDRKDWGNIGFEAEQPDVDEKPESETQASP